MQSNVNVGTKGHVDYGKLVAQRVLGGDDIKKCSCLTKTPQLAYHHRQCKYRLSMEIGYDSKAKDTEPSS